VNGTYCHCTGCQRLHGAPFQWASIFHKHHVRFTKGIRDLQFYNSELNETSHTLPCKLLCMHCKSPIADEGRNMFLAFSTLFKFSDGEIPIAFRPRCHIFYGSRCVDVRDGLPKYAGRAGHSSEIPESESVKWRK